MCNKLVDKKVKIKTGIPAQIDEGVIIDKYRCIRWVGSKSFECDFILLQTKIQIRKIPVSDIIEIIE